MTNKPPFFIKDAEEDILIVVEDPSLQQQLETALQKKYKVFAYNDCKAAQQHLLLHSVAVLLCDQDLSDGQGFEFCKKVKALKHTIECVLILQPQELKDLETSKKFTEIVHVLLKPCEEIYLTQIIDLIYEKSLLSNIRTHFSEWVSLANEFSPHSLEEVSRHLTFGKRVQESLLISRNDPDLSGLDNGILFLPGSDTFNDFYEIYYPGKHIFDLVIGHQQERGLAAALIGTMVKRDIHHFIQPIVSTETYSRKEGWEEALVPLEHMCESLDANTGYQLQILNVQMALTLCRFNFESKKLIYFNNGNPQGIWCKPQERHIIRLKNSHQHYLGEAKQLFGEVYEVEFETNDLFVFLSGGFTEKEETLIYDLIQQTPNITPHELIEELKQKMQNFSTDTDRTLVALKMNRKEALPSRHFFSATFNATLDELERARNFIDNICRDVPGDRDRLIFYLHLVINEIFCNIVEHGYAYDSKGIIIVKGVQEHDGITLEVFDQGTVYMPSEVPEPLPLGNEENRGFGIYIIREVVDQLAYTKKLGKKGWNHLRIFKKYCLGDEIMQLSHTLANDVLIITPNLTSLDAKFASEFKEKIIQLITENEALHVVLDLNQVQFIDSSGLGSFLSVLRLLHAQGGELKLARIHRPIRTMFELVAMNKIFDIHESTEEAIEAFNKE